MKNSEQLARISNFEAIEELRDVLEEVLRFLEEYGRSWYSEELYHRAIKVLVKSTR